MIRRLKRQTGCRDQESKVVGRDGWSWPSDGMKRGKSSWYLAFALRKILCCKRITWAAMWRIVL